MESKIPSYNHQNIINSLEHSPTTIIDPFTPNNERHGCTVICDDDASMIAMPKKKVKEKYMRPIYLGRVGKGVLKGGTCKRGV